jgi:hypothetical protein
MCKRNREAMIIQTGYLGRISKGQRLITIRTGGKNYFVPNALLMWKLSHATGYYYHQVNQDNYDESG